MTGAGVLLDTAFVQALFNRSDQFHQRSRLWFQHLRRSSLRLWTTEAILVEIGNALSASNRKAACDFIRNAYGSPQVEVVRVDTALLSRSLKLYEARPDKTWGLTDCISFVVMGENRLHEALTPDHHFEQAGFVALLRRDPP